MSRDLRTAQGIHDELLHRAWQARAAARVGRTSKARIAEAERAANELEYLAKDITRVLNENVLESEANVYARRPQRSA